MYSGGTQWYTAIAGSPLTSPLLPSNYPRNHLTAPAAGILASALFVSPAPTLLSTWLQEN